MIVNTSYDIIIDQRKRLGGIEMKKMHGFLMLLVLLCATGLFLSGCAEQEIDTEKEYRVTLFFANNAYIQSGDEELDHLVRVGDVLMTAEEGTQYYNLIDQGLRTVPEGVEGATTVIDDRIVLNSVTVKEGTAFVDLAGEKLSGGSMEEGFLISQIVESLLASFEEIKEVQFLVDGAVAESLMGHFDTTVPFSEGI